LTTKDKHRVSVCIFSVQGFSYCVFVFVFFLIIFIHQNGRNSALKRCYDYGKKFVEKMRLEPGVEESGTARRPERM